MKRKWSASLDGTNKVTQMKIKFIPLVNPSDNGMGKITKSELLKLKDSKKDKIKIKRAITCQDEWGIPGVIIHSMEIGMEDIFLKREDVERMEKEGIFNEQ